MDKLCDFPIKANRPLSKSVNRKGIFSFDSLIRYIKNLPYGRNSDRSDYTLVLQEGKGTCSTKHSFLNQIALENNFTGLDLYLGIYKMSNKNTSDIEDILNLYKLDYIPEAHCYLKFQNKIIDCTRNTISNKSFEDSIIYEEKINSQQIGDYKVAKHQAFFQQWIKTHNIPYDFESLWKIRELCILNLHQ